jgi:peptidylprolyl isomerase
MTPYPRALAGHFFEARPLHRSKRTMSGARTNNRRAAYLALGLCLGVLGCNRQHSAPSVVATVADGPPAGLAKRSPGALPDIAPPPDLVVLPARAFRRPSGLATMVLVHGRGSVRPGAFDRVSFRFVGWSQDGKVFDVSGDQPTSEPAVAFVHRLPISGLTEGLRLMVAGERRRMWIPAGLGFRGQRPPGAPEGDIVMDVELVDVLESPEPLPAPADGQVGLRQATSGLRYRLFPSRASGAPRVESSSIAVVNYTVWDAAGNVFDSTIPYARPQSLRVSDLDATWTEAFSLMHKGDSIRFWFAHAGDGDAAQPLLAQVDLLDVYSPR